MKAQILGTMTLTFSIPVDAKSRELGFLKAAYKLSPEIIDTIEVKTIDVQDNVATPEILGWDIEFEEICYDNGEPVD